MAKILNGEIFIGHRPKLKTIERFKSEGFTHLVTLLSEREGAKKLISFAEQHGLSVIWIELENANIIDDKKKLQIIERGLKEITLVLQNGGKLYMHCSAGIHRTGMITNALLNYLGYEKEDAMKCLKSLRQITAEEVGKERIEWGTQFFNLFRNTT